MKEVTREEFEKHLEEEKDTAKSLCERIDKINEKLDKILLWSENLKFSWKAILSLLATIALIVGLITGIGKLLK